MEGRQIIDTVVQLRIGGLDDLNTILEHRLAMFREMGHADPDGLANLERVSREYFESAITKDNYHAVLPEVEGAGIVGGPVW